MQYQIMLSGLLLLKCNYIYKYCFIYVFISKGSTYLATMNSKNALKKFPVSLELCGEYFTSGCHSMLNRWGKDTALKCWGFFDILKPLKCQLISRNVTFVSFRQVNFVCSSLYLVSSKGNIHHAHIKTMIFEMKSHYITSFL